MRKYPPGSDYHSDPPGAPGEAVSIKIVDSTERCVATAMEMRVASAVMDLTTLWYRLQNEGKHEELKARFRTTSLSIETARVAIRAMYEPDDSMLKAYMGALEQPANEHKEPWHNAKMRKRWRAMIDAASPP